MIKSRTVPVSAAREEERPTKADEPREGGENVIEVSNPIELSAMWKWLKGDDTIGKNGEKAKSGRARTTTARVRPPR